MSQRRRGGRGSPGPLPYVPRDEAADGPSGGSAGGSLGGASFGASEPVTRALRAAYAAPEDPRYWDGFEARILAAVRGAAATTAAATTGAMRAVPAAAVEWWHALARWARPAFAAAGVTLVVAGAAAVQSHSAAEAARADSAFHHVLGTPGDGLTGEPLPLPEPDPQLARALDLFEADPRDTAAAAEARVARIAAELLGEGLVRRRPLPAASGAARDSVRAAAPRAAGGAVRQAAPERGLPAAP